mgnify:CR=1 FL=1
MSVLEGAFKSALADALQIDEAEVVPEYTLTPEKWDSLTVVSVVGLIDEHFNVTVSGDDLVKCATLGDLARLVEPKP